MSSRGCLGLLGVGVRVGVEAEAEVEAELTVGVDDDWLGIAAAPMVEISGLREGSRIITKVLASNSSGVE